MRSFLVHWALSSLALALTAWILPGVTVSSPAALVAGALVLYFRRKGWLGGDDELL